ncbi:MAG: SDR family oxidoreductase [Phycisphaerales bacterium JB039]
MEQPIFLTGASGYIGGRLAPRLLRRGYRVRCLARSPEKLADRPWAANNRVEIAAGDVLETEALAESMRGCRIAFYLIHSMGAAGGEFADKDLACARSFAEAARRAGVERIIYLGGLGEMGPDLSEHLRSRREVEEALASTGVAVTTLRAAMIIGSGSASLEILRYLVERLPVMITPRWVSTECQPIAVDNVLEYLIRCVETPQTVGRDIDIGGPDVLTYRALMRIMAEERRLPRRLIIPVPVLTPTLSSLWLGLITPVPTRVGRPLAEGLRNRVVCRDDTAQRLMPQELLSTREAIRLSLAQLDQHDVETIWSAAGVIPGDPDWAGGAVFTDARTIEIDAGPEAVYRAICRIGGGHGWYAADWLWRIRGWMDQLAGGPGLRRGRRDPENVSYGEALDFWRVVGIEPGRRLELRAEMRLPGVAKLEFLIEPGEEAESRLVMTARFQPKGLVGIVYWYAVLPLHGVVFGGMLRGIRRQAERGREEPAPAPG